MGRYSRATGVAVATLAIAGCSSASSPGPTPTRAPTTPAMSPSAAASLAVDTCADTLGEVPGGATTGNLLGTIATGRILIGIEAGQAGTIALASIDATGLHTIPLQRDGTLAHATWAPGGTIVFDSERAGGRHLFRIQTDGTRLVQVTNEAGVAEQAASFTPDGARMTYEDYSCTVEQDFGIQIAAADGSGLVALTGAFPVGSAAWEASPAVSPDGKSIAFARFVDQDHGAVWVIPVAGGEARRLTSDDLLADYPRWSPDGTAILFEGGGAACEPGSKLWVVPAAGGQPHLALKNAADTWECEGDWSPDGSQIVAKVYRSGWDHNELVVASADGSNQQTLWVGTLSTAETPHWGL